MVTAAYVATLLIVIQLRMYRAFTRCSDEQPLKLSMADTRALQFGLLRPLLRWLIIGARYLCGFFGLAGKSAIRVPVAPMLRCQPWACRRSYPSGLYRAERALIFYFPAL